MPTASDAPRSFLNSAWGYPTMIWSSRTQTAPWFNQSTSSRSIGRARIRPEGLRIFGSTICATPTRPICLPMVSIQRSPGNASDIAEVGITLDLLQQHHCGNAGRCRRALVDTALKSAMRKRAQ